MQYGIFWVWVFEIFFWQHTGILLGRSLYSLYYTFVLESTCWVSIVCESCVLAACIYIVEKIDKILLIIRADHEILTSWKSFSFIIFHFTSTKIFNLLNWLNSLERFWHWIGAGGVSKNKPEIESSFRFHKYNYYMLRHSGKLFLSFKNKMPKSKKLYSLIRTYTRSNGRVEEAEKYIEKDMEIDVEEVSSFVFRFFFLFIFPPSSLGTISVKQENWEGSTLLSSVNDSRRWKKFKLEET